MMVVGCERLWTNHYFFVGPQSVVVFDWPIAVLHLRGPRHCSPSLSAAIHHSALYGHSSAGSAIEFHHRNRVEYAQHRTKRSPTQVMTGSEGRAT